jgi:hypothetical protein
MADDEGLDDSRVFLVEFPVCMCVYSYQPEGWLDPHTVLAPDAHTHTPMHTQAHTHKYTYSTPHTTTARRTKPGIEWGRVASSYHEIFPVHTHTHTHTHTQNVLKK